MKSKSGFTIIELLIVIVVIAILATITVVAYTGIQTRASNVVKMNELVAWTKLFKLHQAQNGNFPDLTNGGYCLGTGFPSGAGGVNRCRDYNSTTTGYVESNASSLMNALQSVGSLPGGGSRVPINGTVGPYVIYNTTNLVFFAVLEGNQASECPEGSEFSWTDGTRRLLCTITLYK